MRILLYTRRGCHLCEEAEDLLTAHGVPAALVDVDESPEAAARYDLRVPVLEIDGQVVGTLGVIGPTRMAYDRMIQIVDITSRMVSHALSQK